VVSENTPFYTIDARYPKDAPPYVGKAIIDIISAFKEENNLDHLTPEDIQVQGLGGDRKYALDIKYNSYGSVTDSFVFTIYQDTLGAHPNTFYRTFTFDRQGREVTLGDLFVSGSNYLERLSTLAYTRVVDELRERAGEPTPEMLDTVRIGTSPTPETLQFFYVNGNKLHLLFPPYQVAAYAAGSFDVSIPLSELDDILLPEYKMQ
jgi:hypothetical protein